MTRLRGAALLALTILTTTACTESEAPMASMTDTAAQQIVERYAEEALDLSGWSGFSEQRLSPGPCVGRQGEHSDTIYAMQGTYQLMVPLPQQAAMLQRVKAGWAAAGYTITGDRTFPDDSGGEVKATNPADGAQLRLTSGEPPAMRLLIHSGCYQRTA